MPKIETLYAFVWCATKSDEEGIMWYRDNDKLVNMVCADKDKLKTHYIPIADDMSKDCNRPYKLVLFRKTDILNESILKEENK